MKKYYKQFSGMIEGEKLEDADVYSMIRVFVQ